jgi:uncharacterized membrane protein YwzB
MLCYKEKFLGTWELFLQFSKGDSRTRNILDPRVYFVIVSIMQLQRYLQKKIFKLLLHICLIKWMYFDLQGIFISVVNYRLRLIHVNAYIKKAKFFEVRSCLIYTNIKSNYIIHRIYFRALISLLATVLKQSNIPNRIQITDNLSVVS